MQEFETDGRNGRYIPVPRLINVQAASVRKFPRHGRAAISPLPLRNGPRADRRILSHTIIHNARRLFPSFLADVVVV